MLSNSVRIAGFILLALVGYFVFRTVTRPAPPTAAETAALNAPAENIVPEVTVRPTVSQPHVMIASLKGRTEPDRAVTVKAETTGTVINARVREGQFVRAGTVLCGLDVESRAARIDEAQAAVASARLDHEAAVTLEGQGWTTSNRAAATKATLDRAEAALAAARIELSKTRVLAPFDGVFETRLAEAGDFLAPGGACGMMVDLDPIIIAVDVTEQQVLAVPAGAPADVILADATRLQGAVRYIARAADMRTRTFRVEIEAPNTDGAIAAGLTADVRMALGEAQAVLLSPASLVLHDDGRVGVRFVDDADTVRFSEITVIDDAPDGIWVTGLPDNTRLLSAGQDFIREGVKVKTLPEQGL